MPKLYYLLLIGFTFTRICLVLLWLKGSVFAFRISYSVYELQKLKEVSKPNVQLIVMYDNLYFIKAYSGKDLKLFFWFNNLCNIYVMCFLWPATYNCLFPNPSGEKGIPWYRNIYKTLPSWYSSGFEIGNKLCLYLLVFKANILDLSLYACHHSTAC